LEGRTQGGVGINPPPLELDILQKLYCFVQRRLIASAYFLLVNLSTYCKCHGINLHANFTLSETIVFIFSAMADQRKR